MAKDEFTKLMKKGEVDDSYNIRGDNVASSRSRGGKFDKDKTKQSGQQAQELPEWAKDMPEYITVKVWDLD
jgi:hypothetical protein